MPRQTRAYNREAAVAYAHKWAFGRNPAYYDFEQLGGDCTNYASQSILAGVGVMNETPDTGWYYYDVNNRAPAWTSVAFLYQFLTTNKGRGPFGREVEAQEAEAGDLVQLMLDKPYFQHSPVIVGFRQSVGVKNLFDMILVAAHSIDSDNRPLSSYDIHGVRFIKIDGFRK
jgi:hypothetical protein